MWQRFLHLQRQCKRLIAHACICLINDTMIECFDSTIKGDQNTFLGQMYGLPIFNYQGTYMQNNRFHKFLYLAFCTGLPVVASITSPLMPEWIASMYFNRDSLFSIHSFCNVDAGGCLQQLSSKVISKLLEWTYDEHITCFHEFCKHESTFFSFHQIFNARCLF